MSHRNGPHIDLANRVLHEDGWLILKRGRPEGFYYTRRHARAIACNPVWRIVRARRIIVWKDAKS
jgi:hypothetical protein